jgi:transcriptional repressor NrdR
MDCYICGKDTKVVNSRAQTRLNQVWRRRLCNHCDYIFTTIEKIDLERSISVKTNSGNITPFIKEKLLISINSSLGHRKNHVSESIALTDTIISKLCSKYKNSLIGKADIINVSQEVLKNFDKTASIYYGAYYKSS